MKTFLEICLTEGIIISNTEIFAKRLQRYYPRQSVNFLFDEASIELLKNELAFKNMNLTFIKKMAENIIIAHREKYRKNNATRLSLMDLEDYPGYRDTSFYYSIEPIDVDNNDNSDKDIE